MANVFGQVIHCQDKLSFYAGASDNLYRNEHLTQDILSAIVCLSEQTDEGFTVAGMRFDQQSFLAEIFENPKNVLSLFTRYGFVAPEPPAVEKWFQRGRIPSFWFPILLCLIELEKGGPSSLGRYVRSTK